MQRRVNTLIMGCRSLGATCVTWPLYSALATIKKPKEGSKSVHYHHLWRHLLSWCFIMMVKKNMATAAIRNKRNMDLTKNEYRHNHIFSNRKIDNKLFNLFFWLFENEIKELIIGTWQLLINNDECIQILMNDNTVWDIFTWRIWTDYFSIGELHR